MRTAIKTNVPHIQRNYLAITGKKRDRSFFYREAGISDDLRQTTIERFSEVYFSIATANRQSGKLIEAGIEKMIAVVDSFSMQRMPRDFWTVEEDLSNAMVELRKAKISGDFVRMALAANRIEQGAKEIVRNVSVGVGVN